ncbi:hypothetical protein SPURM210S_02037 [Streptomyces purpurascens]|nr:hypothetical protein GCM10010303_44530 [Streptomyces purpurascens]
MALNRAIIQCRDGQLESPDGFRFYDLRHTGHTLSTRSGATLKGLDGGL